MGWQGGAVFLLSLGWFCWRLAPGLTVGDSGEFAAAGAILGVAHSPGYPLYLLFVKAVQLLAPGSLAYRSNVLSAVLLSGAMTLLWDCWRRVSAAPSWFLMLFLILVALYGPVLAIGTETEVFSLLAFSATAIFWSLSRGKVLAALFIFGLSLGNHHTLLLLAPAFLVLAFGIIREQRLNWLRWAGVGMMALLLGLSIYAYLPLSAARGPALNWGDPDNFSRFWRVISRKDYGSVSLTVEGAEARKWSMYAKQSARWLRAMTQDVPGAAMLILGIAGIFVAPPFVGAACVLGLLLSGPFFLWLGNPPFDPQTSGALERFFVLPFLSLTWTIPWALHWIWKRVGQSSAGMGALTAAALALAAGSVYGSAAPRRDHYLLYDFGRNILRSLPRHSYFLMEGGDDPMYSMAYFLFAEGRRSDLGSAQDPSGLKVRDRPGLVYPSIYGFEFRSTPREQRRRLREVFETRLAGEAPLFYQSLNLDLIAPAELIPVGIIQYREGSGQGIGYDAPLWPFYSQRGLWGSPASHYRERALIPYYYFARGQTAAWQNRPQEALRDWNVTLAKGGDALWATDHVSRQAGRYGAQLFEQGHLQEALELTRLAAFAGAQEPSYAVNICVILSEQGHIKESLSCFETAKQNFPVYPALYKNFGATLMKAGRRSESRSVFRRYYELTKDPSTLQWINP